MVCRQYLPLSIFQLKGKHCQKSHCRNGVVDKFGHMQNWQKLFHSPFGPSNMHSKLYSCRDQPLAQEGIKYIKAKEQSKAYCSNLNTVLHYFPLVLSIWVLTVSYLNMKHFKGLVYWFISFHFLYFVSYKNKVQQYQSLFMYLRALLTYIIFYNTKWTYYLIISKLCTGVYLFCKWSNMYIFATAKLFNSLL